MSQACSLLGPYCTAVQNPLTTLPDAVASVVHILYRQDGPTVLVGHSFSGVLVSETGAHPKVSALISAATTQAAWRALPSFYAVSALDRTIDPELERFMARRMGATTIKVNASHLSMVCHPDPITHLILQAANHGA